MLAEKPNNIKPCDPEKTKRISEELGEELKTKLEAHSAVPRKKYPIPQTSA